MLECVNENVTSNVLYRLPKQLPHRHWYSDHQWHSNLYEMRLRIHRANHRELCQ